MSKWTIARGIQLIIGIVFLSDYLSGNSSFSLVFGGMMFIQAVLNIGCFSSKGCSTSTRDDSTIEAYNPDDVEYEVVNK